MNWAKCVRAFFEKFNVPTGSACGWNEADDASLAVPALGCADDVRRGMVASRGLAKRSRV